MRVQVMRYEFLKVLPWQGPVREFNPRNVFSLGLYGPIFIENSSYQESIVFMNLIFSLFVVISYDKNRL